MLEQARGAFIAQCDGDDFWLDSKKLYKQVNFLSQHPEYVLSFHRAKRIYEKGFRNKEDRVEEGVYRDIPQGNLRVLSTAYMLMGTVMHRNVGLDFPPEYYLAPNGDIFVPILLGAHGGAKFQEEVGPLGQRRHPRGAWSSKTLSQKLSMHFRTYLQIASYFVRMEEPKSVFRIAKNQLRQVSVKYFTVHLNFDKESKD